MKYKKDKFWEDVEVEDLIPKTQAEEEKRKALKEQQKMIKCMLNNLESEHNDYTYKELVEDLKKYLEVEDERKGDKRMIECRMCEGCGEEVLGGNDLCKDCTGIGN